MKIYFNSFGEALFEPENKDNCKNDLGVKIGYILP